MSYLLQQALLSGTEETCVVQIAEKLQKALADVVSAHPHVTVHIRILALLTPSIRGSFYDLPLCIAEMLCSEADALHCQGWSPSAV